jgi:hypothetical protein
MSNLPTTPKTPEERLQALARSASVETLLKFTTGVWSIAGTPVPAGTRFVLYPDQVSAYWIKFVDNKPAEEIIALVGEDEGGDIKHKIVMGKSRADLGDHDESLWELDNAGKPKDPWSYGLGLPAMNAETGAIVVFKAGSLGAMGATAGQVASWMRNAHLGFPIVELSTGSYKNKKFGGFTSFPVFTNVGYDSPPLYAPGPGNGSGPASGGNAGGGGARVISINKNDGVTESSTVARYDREMDDSIPF